MAHVLNKENDGWGSRVWITRFQSDLVIHGNPNRRFYDIKMWATKMTVSMTRKI